MTGQGAWSAILEELDGFQREHPRNLPGASFGLDDGEGMRIASVGDWKPDSIACIGSMTKAFIGAATLLALEPRAADDLERPAWTFPGLSALGGDETRRRITLRNLLQHTSGLSHMMSIDEFPRCPEEEQLPIDDDPRAGPVSPWVGSPGLTNELVLSEGRRRPARRATLADVANHVMRRYPLLSEPGSRYSYATANYIIAAHLVEQLTGEPINHYIRRRLFEKLGMRDSFFVACSTGDAELNALVEEGVTDEQRARVADVAYLTTGSRVPVEAAPGPDLETWDKLRGDWRFLLADLGMYSTVADLLSFLSMLRSGGTHGSRRVLPEGVVRLLIDDQGHGHTMGFGHRRRTAPSGETFSVLEHMGIGMTYFWYEKRSPEPLLGTFLSQRVCNMAVDNNMGEGMRAIFRVFLPAVARAADAGRGAGRAIA